MRHTQKASRNQKVELFEEIQRQQEMDKGINARMVQFHGNLKTLNKTKYENQYFIIIKTVFNVVKINLL